PYLTSGVFLPESSMASSEPVAARAIRQTPHTHGFPCPHQRDCLSAHRLTGSSPTLTGAALPCMMGAMWTPMAQAQVQKFSTEWWLTVGVSLGLILVVAVVVNVIAR